MAMRSPVRGLQPSRARRPLGPHEPAEAHDGNILAAFDQAEQRNGRNSRSTNSTGATRSGVRSTASSSGTLKGIRR